MIYISDAKEFPMNQLPEAFLHDIPKTDLHVHLDGSMRIETLIELARELLQS